MTSEIVETADATQEVFLDFIDIINESGSYVWSGGGYPLEKQLSNSKEYPYYTHQKAEKYWVMRKGKTPTITMREFVDKYGSFDALGFEL